MRISGFTTVRPNGPHYTRTYEEFSKFLGAKPARIGLVATLYDQYTITHLTEALMNIYTSDKVSKNSWQRLNEFMFEWDVEINRIKRVPILSMEGNGMNAGDIIFRFLKRPPRIDCCDRAVHFRKGSGGIHQTE